METMTKLLLFHNSDFIRQSFTPNDQTRPIFYWYSDRFASHDGTTEYLHLFLVDPIDDNVQLRSRSSTQDFDGLHRQYLHYKDFKEGRYPELMYDEPGIAMSFSTLIPDLILQTHSRDDQKPSFLQQTYEIVYPTKHATKDSYINLFYSPYDKLYDDKPIRFSEIPEIVAALPDIENTLPFQDIQPDCNGNYQYDRWLPMTSHKPGTWL